MEYFNYIQSNTEIGKRSFFSNPLVGALLIWSNTTSFPFPTGFSLVENMENESSPQFAEIVRKQMNKRIPFLHIKYNNNLDFFVIDNEKYSSSDAANLIANTFDLRVVDNHIAKAANVNTQVKDPFHSWSRSLFANTSKLDLDGVIFTPNLNKVSSIVEIKRSNIPVGSWNPFVRPNSKRPELNDGPNYLMKMSLANILNVNMHTIHHLFIDNITDETSLDLFTYQPIKQVLNQNVLNDFANSRNRRVITAGSSTLIL